MHFLGSVIKAVKNANTSVGWRINESRLHLYRRNLAMGKASDLYAVQEKI